MIIILVLEAQNMNLIITWAYWSVYLVLREKNLDTRTCIKIKFHWLYLLNFYPVRVVLNNQMWPLNVKYKIKFHLILLLWLDIMLIVSTIYTFISSRSSLHLRVTSCKSYSLFLMFICLLYPRTITYIYLVPL